MATKPTGRAASLARNETRKAKLTAAGVKTVVAGAPKPTPTVAGASTTGLNAAQIGGASGIGFESAADQAKISSVVEATTRAGGSKSQGGDKFGIAAKRAADLAAAKDRKEQRDTLRQGGRLATDNLRASNLNTTAEEGITNKGARSSIAGRDERQRTGAGTEDNPLTDIQIEDLESQGIREGDLVPGKGFLTPLGTFRSPYDKKAEDLAAAATDLSNKDKAPTDNITSSDETVVNEEKAATDTVNESAKVVRDLTYLDDEITRIQDDLKSEIEAIKSQAEVDKANKVGAQASETGQTSVGLANAGGYLGFSGSATGVLLNLAKTHRAELQSLDAQRQQAIFEAQDAARDSQFDLVKLKAQELKDIEQEEYNRKQDYLEQTRKINEKEAEKKEKAKTQNSIFNAIKMGIKTPEGIFSALGGDVDIAEISKFLDGIDAGDEASFKFSATQNASLLGTGMSILDINTLKEYINENGYDDKVKSSLTPTQKMAVDKIFLPKPEGSKPSKYDVVIKGETLNKLSGLGYRPEDIKNIEYVLNNYGVESVLYGEDDPDKRAELAVILGAETALSSVEETLNPPTTDDVITDIVSTMSDEQKTKLKSMSDQADISSMWTGKKTDIENLLKTPEMTEQLQIAIDNGLTTEEILQALTE